MTISSKSNTARNRLAVNTIERAPEGIFWVRATGFFYQANEWFYRLLGYSEEELRALHVCDVAIDLEKAQWDVFWRQAGKPGGLRHEGGLATKLQESVIVEIRACLLPIDGDQLMCAFVRDLVDPHRETEPLLAELRASEARFRTLYNNTPVMLQACDHETRLYSANKYWLETLGYEWEEVKGRQTREFMTEASRDNVIHRVIPVLLESGSIHDFEYQMVKKNGQVLDVALTAVSERDSDGDIIRTLSMILPISDRKRAERLESQNVFLREELSGAADFAEIIGHSPPLQEVFQAIDMVAGTDATVLLLGETGTGKELAARAIHERSDRSKSVMITVNCAALQPNLVESELFGHEKGAFTGALTTKKGRFELADHSTIFLDEVGELSLEAQSKLLRVLQEQEVERVGGTETVGIDVRIIAATNRPLEVEVSKGNFRADLYYRLNIFPIRMPPLRDRIDDIPLLTNHFVDKFAQHIGKKIPNINRKVIEKLVSYPWPGNVRELANILERAVILCPGRTLQPQHIGVDAGVVQLDDDVPTLAESEYRLILRALEKCDGRLSGPKGAAAILGVNRSTLWSRMHKLGIDISRKIG
ncbi:sigma-54 interaction domain-containing protein [Desulfofustis glycolicus]|uniref:PAS domain-containing protein n=1 Tax=Desulfofustis glycolicus DSM 9705 TaxID=1121409 RepID=A0A1M5WZQ6_9BACT|nr:sigma-54-dependent Fis family transcriptional regulator [Desulfofustis glycolicus]MCB2218649.1 sigma-54-dependent Fis family transcriptional regulator [Desulfobulbaceae bacterium]SHH93155.1 PAS domain-containing protein [Desulfofustis glycolicus DSM 9705]